MVYIIYNIIIVIYNIINIIYIKYDKIMFILYKINLNYKNK